MQPGERGRVVRVIDGDSLVLDTGQSVRLVGIEAPAFGRGERIDQPHARESRRLLEDLVLGRKVRLYYGGLTRDRYDRALAHLVTDDALGPRLWVNRELLVRGAARFRAYPDTERGLEPLQAAEREAIAARTGLWRRRAYAIADARDLADPGRGFLIVEAILGPREAGRAEDAVCWRRLMASQFSLEVRPAAMAICDLPAGLKVRVRGWQSGGRMELSAASNLLVLDETPLAVAREG